MNNILNNQLNYISKIKNIVENNNLNLNFTVVTFGCQMNAKDSEKLVGILTECGFNEILDEQKADIVIYNTCTVRENANERLYGRIGQLKQSYYNNKNKIIGICGCMMQEKDEIIYIKNKYPYVKLMFGVHNLFKFPELLYILLITNKKIIQIEDENEYIIENLPTKNKFEFKCGINIMTGCNNFCTYCIVPYVRGREKSRPYDDIIDEIKLQTKKGIKEIMLLGQNVNSYGNDFKTQQDVNNFPDLLDKICQIEEVKRIRFMTSHPKDLSDELINIVKNNNKICKHIHLPLQSGSDNILKMMNRKYDIKHYFDLVDKIKNEINDISITTDIIVGFPGETDEDFNKTLEAIKYCRFNSVYSFIYSKRTGTKAATYLEQIPKDVVNDRFNRMLDLIKQISYDVSLQYVDKVYDCMIEDFEIDKNLLVGRIGQNYLVYLDNNNINHIGDIVKAKIKKSHNFYFDGEIV